MHIKELQKMILSGLLLGLAIVLPFLTGQLPTLGSALLPMHIPILLCGFICGPKYGGIIGFIAPLLRSVLFSMPPLYPIALAMAFELATYGLIAGLLFSMFKHYQIIGIYFSLIVAMLAGRLVLGAANTILLGLSNETYAFKAFITAAFVYPIIGIILQLILIPITVFAVERYTYSRGRRQWS
jgi:thiamine transporter ThiT